MNIDIPAPTGGWNARDHYAAMKLNQAVRLNNIIPENGYCRSRGGSLTYVSGFNGPINTLSVYDDGLNSKLIACESGNIWDSSDPGSLVQLKTGNTSDYYDTMMFTKKLVMVNGADTPQVYDGGASTVDMVATLEDSGGVIAGISIADIVGCEIFKGRAFYWLSNEQRFFYADFAGAYQGTLKEFKLDRQAKKGGSIVSIFTHARDTGSGLDDYLVIMFNTGECLVYQGNDPASATDWSLVQRYNIGKLVSPRCVIQKGGDNLLVTNEGLINFSLAIQGASAQNENHTGSLVVNAVSSAAKKWKDESNWEVNYFPEHSFIIVNVPLRPVDNLYTQYVLNTSSGAWCSFTELNATTWISYNNKLYFGDANGNIIQADVGLHDNTEYIGWDVISAFSNFGKMGAWKKCTGAGIICNQSIKKNIALKILSDYDTTKIVNISFPTEAFDLRWDKTPGWDKAGWAKGNSGEKTKPQLFFYPAQGKGHTLAIKLKGYTRQTELQWYSSVLRLKTGKIK